jgi:sugar phosphate isomerase/epimerase
MGVPGTPQKGIDDEEAWSNATETLRRMAGVAMDEGVSLNVEPHAGSLIQEPEAAMRMAGEVPGLAFTLDYAHFAQRGVPQERVYPLHRQTRHMHARQARPGSGGVAVEDGAIDFGAIVRDLAANDWDGVIAMEFFGGVMGKPWKEHAVVQNVALAHEIASRLGESADRGSASSKP